MAQDQLWGSLVKAMTKKIEVPRLGGAPSPVTRGVTPADLKQYAQAPAPPPGGARPAPPPTADAASGRRASDGAILTGTYRQVAPKSDGPATVSAEAAIERIASHLDYLTRSTVEKYLDAHGGRGGPVTARLAALGLVENTEDDWWSAVSGGVDPEILAELLRTAPACPSTAT
jgi:hypothetical protein